jgi:hypothetical protein
MFIGDATVLDHQHAVGRGCGFRDVMGHQDCGKLLMTPDLFEQLLHGELQLTA